MSNPVFAHYLVGGMTAEQAITDVSQAKKMGFDAFALNVMSTESWSTDSIGHLFEAALAIGFYLFFSFDMLHFSSASAMLPLIEQYAGHGAYYMKNSLPFVSTFYGGRLGIDWENDYKKALSDKGISTYFVPNFGDALQDQSDPSGLYRQFPAVDGLFSWDSAWPFIAEGKTNVSSSVDEAYITAAKEAGKSFMMPISALQFKHLDSANNWYRRGELNLVQRIPQILAAKPDFVEFLTWNDGGESSYIGNVWPYAIDGTNVAGYTDDYDHSAWGNIISPFIAAYKAGSSDIADIVPANGAKASGAIWYHTILTTATCASDSIGKPDGWSNAEDLVHVAVLLSEAGAGSLIKVYNGDDNEKLAEVVGVKGLNSFSVNGLNTGKVVVDIVEGITTIASAKGGKDVAADAAICNYNYHVVGFE
ncbi:glycoside hydrolase [Bisporella sp. PMI_857]|nr:glycoside hydrolase [Bisporella sp. PMI_857]